jgi:hypothetical protein
VLAALENRIMNFQPSGHDSQDQRNAESRTVTYSHSPLPPDAALTAFNGSLVTWQPLPGHGQLFPGGQTMTFSCTNSLAAAAERPGESVKDAESPDDQPPPTPDFTLDPPAAP